MSQTIMKILSNISQIYNLPIKSLGKKIKEEVNRLCKLASNVNITKSVVGKKNT